MERPLLISAEDFIPFKSLSINLPTERLEPFILEAQDFDLCEALGLAFYSDLLTNRTEDNYKKLLEGESYEYNGTTLRYNGLKSALVYFTFARLVSYIDIHSTATGFVTKTNDYSQPITDAARAKLYNNAKESAAAVLRATINYISAKAEDFTIKPAALCASNPTSRGGITISKASRYGKE